MSSTIYKSCYMHNLLFCPVYLIFFMDCSFGIYAGKVNMTVKALAQGTYLNPRHFSGECDVLTTA